MNIISSILMSFYVLILKPCTYDNYCYILDAFPCGVMVHYRDRSTEEHYRIEECNYPTTFQGNFRISCKIE